MIKKITIIWECDFKAELEKPENQVFKKSIQPNLIFFTRLKGREAQNPGIRATYCHKWTKFENPKENLHFLDINGSYSQTCLENNFDFPYGKARILINKTLEDENIVFENGKLISKSSKKLIFGLIKAQIVPTRGFEPFFPLKFEDRTYYVYCKTCLEKKLYLVIVELLIDQNYIQDFIRYSR